MRDARLDDSIIVQATLVDTDLTGASMIGATLTGATIGRTVFGSQDLSRTDGLDTIRHVFPSIIDIDTFYRSGSGLSRKFLLRAGVRSTAVDYLDSLIAAETPIQFYSCFISYSTANEGFAERLYSDLESHGVRCWFAPRDMKSGRKLYDQIKAGIQMQDRLLVILSEESVNSSWVRTELVTAREREVHEKRSVLFPISIMPFERLRRWECFDSDTGQDLARTVREYFIPDFSDWANTARYGRELQRLVHSLKQGSLEKA